jgi:hypothetical protein
MTLAAQRKTGEAADLVEAAVSAGTWAAAADRERQAKETTAAAVTPTEAQLSKRPAAVAALELLAATDRTQAQSTATAGRGRLRP